MTTFPVRTISRRSNLLSMRCMASIFSEVPVASTVIVLFGNIDGLSSEQLR